MNLKNNLSYLLIISLLSIFACHYEPAVPMSNNNGSGGNNGGNNNGGNNGNTTLNPCNPDSSYFQNDVLPILVSNCAKSGCHDAISKKEGVQTTDYTTVMKITKPFTLSDGDLYKYITHKDSKKIMPPPPAAPLTAAQKQSIATWILQGAKNNACDANATGCNTQDVKYSTFIKPLLEKSCNGCHSGSQPSANIALDTHAKVQQSAKSGTLYGSVSHSTGYSKMPKGGTKWDNCDILKLKAWIDAGALNN